MSNTSRYLPTDQYVNRPCAVCGNNIDDMRKASAIRTGAGLAACVHDSCAASLQDEISETLSYAKNFNAPQRQYAGISEDWNGRMEQVGVGGSMNGGESGVGKHALINKPCLVCQQQVTSGVVIDIGGTTYATHPACKQRLLESIAGSLDPGNLQNNHQASIVRGVGNGSLL